jgi:hypothetical protein
MTDEHSNVRVLQGHRDWRAVTADALDAQVEGIDTALTVLRDLEELLGNELVMEPGTVQTSHLDHEIRSLAALLRSARTERAQQAERLRAALKDLGGAFE